MCKVIRTKWSELSAPVVCEMLKDFPQCGIKYTGKFGIGLVLVKRDKDITLRKIQEKAIAANPKESHYAFIPDNIALAAGL